MACEKNLTKAAGAASGSGGITNTNSKMAATGTVMANRLLDVVDREGSIAVLSRSKIGRFNRAVNYTARMAPLTVAATAGGVASVALGGIPGYMAFMGTLTAAGGVLAYKARLKADKSNGPIQEIDVPQRYIDLEDAEERRISIWPKKKDPSTVVFNVPMGPNWEKSCRDQGSEKYTCLKATGLFSPEFYFRGELSNEDAVKVATGQETQYHKMAGYVGLISGHEKFISPAWAMAKRAVILQSLGGDEDTPAHKMSGNIRAGACFINRTIQALREHPPTVYKPPMKPGDI